MRIREQPGVHRVIRFNNNKDVTIYRYIHGRVNYWTPSLVTLLSDRSFNQFRINCVTQSCDQLMISCWFWGREDNIQRICFGIKCLWSYSIFLFYCSNSFAFSQAMWVTKGAGQGWKSSSCIQHWQSSISCLFIVSHMQKKRLHFQPRDPTKRAA